MKALGLGLMIYTLIQLIGCGPTLDPEEQMDLLMDQRWLLESVQGVESYQIDTLLPNYLSFTSEMPDAAMGFAGCNTVAGRYQLDGNLIEFDRVLTTKKACPDMELEQLMVQALEQTNNYRIVKNKLEFYKDRKLLAVFVKDDGDYFLPVPFDLN
jgi:heat shock protein HslJ